MTREFDINTEWDPEIKSLCRRFNKYARKHSLKLVSEVIDSIIDLLQSDSKKKKYDAAEALSRIKIYNPNLISDYAQSLIEPIIKEKLIYYKEDSSSVSSSLSSSSSSTSPSTSSSSEYIKINFTENKDAIKKSLEDYSLNAEFNAINNDFKPNQFNSKSNDEIDEPRVISVEDESKNYIQGNNQSQFNIDINSNVDDFNENLMNRSIKDLKIKNIKKIKKKEEHNSRKCALGDGIFEDYKGNIYICTCGTLYHENCLKIQAIYTGYCQICEREFLKMK